MNFLPTSAKEVKARGWDELDVILFSGDSYVDHSAFGVAVIARVLEDIGLRVAIVPQPNWRDDLRDFRKLGAPRLFFGVSAGNMDSMVNHYTAAKRLRSDDAYTAGGKAGFRPDYAATVYTKILKQIYPNVPVVLGGIEASLRRLAHYDYWQDRLLPSILVDSGADILSYGMGEQTIVSIARAMHNGFNPKLLRKIPQVAFVADKKYISTLDKDNSLMLHSFESCKRDKRLFAENFRIIETESNRLVQRTIIEPTGEGYVVVNPALPPTDAAQTDYAYSLPYTRLPHPRYKGKQISAYEMIKFSVNLHRGCFGGCSFCTISAHQGKFISSRSEESILSEVKRIVEMPEFKGYLSDLGGPSANMYRMSGRDKSICEKCSRPSCLFPAKCSNLDNTHKPLLSLYKKVDAVKGIKKSFIGSGIRYDLFEEDGGRYLREVVVNHTSGRLKVAPEHTEPHVLNTMRKPSFSLFERLHKDFYRICEQESLRYQLIPYFISSHPRCVDNDMAALHKRCSRLNLHLEQVQDFTPTPMTLSSAMFYSGIDPYTGERVEITRDIERKRRQKEYFFRRDRKK